MVEFGEKLQTLRKRKGLTQEELAAALFVSRTAISKWESGRGYPGIDSLKAIAAFFGVTVDELLSGEELLTLAAEDTKAQQTRVRDLVFGLLDCSTALYLVLPLFGQTVGDTVTEVSLLDLTAVQPYMRVAFFVAVIALVIVGIATLALQAWQHPRWLRVKSMLSLILGVVTALLFILALQPYAAVLAFVFLIIKAFVLLKRR